MTDVSTTRRKSMTPTRRLRIFEANKGLCVTCGQPIRAGDRWFIEHIRALELGGEDTDENCAPAHYACKAEKDADDHHRAAKAKRNKARHIGITAPKQKIKSAGFPKRERTHEGRPSLPPRNLYEERS
jgi:5-methylcytosine-specific restriction protein A